MASETIIWTVLPNGRSGNRLGFSLFVSPRLLANGTLGNFGLLNWAKRMASLRVALEFEGSPAVEAELDRSHLNPEAWDRLFPDSTPVRGWQLPPHASRELKSFPAHTLHQFIKGLYATVISTSPASFPSLTEGPVADLVNTVGRLDEVVCQALGRQTVGVAALPSQPPLICQPRDERTVLRLLGTGPARDFFQARQFYNRRPSDKIAYLDQPIPPGSPPPEVNEVDFHQAIGMLGDWPLVLRMLGLVIDGSIELRNIPFPATGRVRVSGMDVQPALGSPPELPWTRYQLDESDFRSAPRADSDLAGRMLRLGKKGAFEVMQVDIDGAALNVLQFATSQRHYQLEALRNGIAPAANGNGLSTNQNLQNLAALKTTFASDAPTHASLPALRGGGITIARVNRSDRMKAAFVNATANNSAIAGGPGLAPSFFADDLLRGYRIDVFSNGNWHSLCRRQAKVILPGGVTAEIDCRPGAPSFQEGYVKGSGGATAPGDGPTDPLYVHESMFGWSGWSLVAARPGRVVTPMPDPANPAAKKDVPVAPRPNTIPADRPDVMLKVPFQIESEVHAQPKSLPRLRYGQKYRLRARAVDLAGNSIPYDAAPPSALGDILSEEILYQRYEPVASPVVNPRGAMTLGEHLETLVMRSKANPAVDPALPDSLFNAVSERHILPPRTSEMTYETHGLLDGFASPAAAYEVARRESGTLQDRAPDAQIMNPDGSLYADGASSADDAKWPLPGEPLAPGRYVAHIGGEVAVPWLGDPMSVGATFIGFPGHVEVPAPFPDAVTAPGTPPAVRSVRLTLTSGAPSFGPTSGQLLKATLPPGSIVKLRMASLVNKDRLPELAIWNLLPAATQAVLANFAARGLLWMLSPNREIQLVHAVERPIDPPVLAVAPIAEEAKPVGRTHSLLQGTVTSHSGSTAEVEVAATWQEVEDRIDVKTGETRQDRSGHIGFLKIPYGENGRPFPRPGEDAPKHEFGDTKHRRVAYNLVGTTRFLENFPAEVINRKDLVTHAGPPAPPVIILSTKRPDPPRVVYIVPTFKWDSSADGKSRKRIGRGLRIYLDRPWYSSGDEELLGIVLGQPRGAGTGTVVGVGITPAIRRYISEWGSDPVTSGPMPNVDRELGPVDFDPTGAILATDLTLDELDSPVATVQALGYTPVFSVERQMWYVDLEMNPGRAYFPYVRLAMARLQVHAIRDAKLSPVVRTEFAQLVADRTATINRTRENKLELIDVTLAGVSASTALGARLQGSAAAGAIGAAAQTPGPNLPPVIGPNLPPVVIPGALKDPAAGAGHVVRVHVERRPLGMAGDMGWERNSPDVILASYRFLFSPEVLWKGVVQRKLPGSDNAYQFRLVIRELEIYDTDAEVAGTPPPASVALPPMGERLVFLDVFPLD